MQNYRRSIFLIDKKFQLRFALYTCGWLLALSFIYPLIIYNLFTYFIRVLELDPNGPGVALLVQTKHEVLWLLIVFQLIFVALGFLISLFVSHRIAGPLYKLRKFFASARGSAISTPLHFRKKDHFQELADDYNAFTASIVAQANESRAALDQGTATLEAALPEASTQAREQLERALTQLREARDRLPH